MEGTSKAEAIRAIALSLVNNPAVDISGEAASAEEEVVANILAWASQLRDTREQHARLGQELSSECVTLRTQFEGLLRALALKPEAFATDKPAQIVEQLMGLVADVSETWDSVRIEPGEGEGSEATPPSEPKPDEAGGAEGGGGEKEGGAPAGGAAKASDVASADGGAEKAVSEGEEDLVEDDTTLCCKRTFRYTIGSRGVLRLKFSNAAQNAAYMPSFVGNFKASAATIALKIHRDYTCEDEQGNKKTEKLPVEYEHSVGQARWKRALIGGFALAMLRSDYSKSQGDHDAYMFSKRLVVEEEHTYLLSARPGDVFVCEVGMAPGGTPVTLDATFLDMKLAGAIEHLDAASTAYSSRGVAGIDVIEARVEALRKARKERDEHNAEMKGHGEELAALQGAIDGLRSDIANMATTVATQLQQEAAEGAEQRRVAEEEELAAEKAQLETKTAAAVAAVERTFQSDKDALEQTPGAAEKSRARDNQLAALCTELADARAAALAEVEAAEAEAAAAEATNATEEARLEGAFDEAKANRDAAENEKLRQARMRMKNALYQEVEQRVKTFLANHHAALDAAVEARRACIKLVRSLPNQEQVREMLSTWDHKRCNERLLPFI